MEDSKVILGYCFNCERPIYEKRVYCSLCEDLLNKCEIKKFLEQKRVLEGYPNLEVAVE